MLLPIWLGEDCASSSTVLSCWLGLNHNTSFSLVNNPLLTYIKTFHVILCSLSSYKILVRNLDKLFGNTFIASRKHWHTQTYFWSLVVFWEVVVGFRLFFFLKQKMEAYFNHTFSSCPSNIGILQKSMFQLTCYWIYSPVVLQMRPGDSVLKTGITLAIFGTKTDGNDWSPISVIQLFHLQVSSELSSECHLPLEIYSCPFCPSAQRTHLSIPRFERHPPIFFLIKKDYVTKFSLNVHTYKKEDLIFQLYRFLFHFLITSWSYRFPADLHSEHTRKSHLLFMSMPLTSYFFDYFLNMFFSFYLPFSSHLATISKFKEFVTFSETLFTHGRFTHILYS